MMLEDGILPIKEGSITVPLLMPKFATNIPPIVHPVAPSDSYCENVPVAQGAPVIAAIHKIKIPAALAFIFKCPSQSLDRPLYSNIVVKNRLFVTVSHLEIDAKAPVPLVRPPTAAPRRTNPFCFPPGRPVTSKGCRGSIMGL